MHRTDAEAGRPGASLEEDTLMSGKKKVEKSRKSMVDENEAKYGKEARAKYGDEAVDFAYQRIRGMSDEQHADLQKLTVELNEAIKAAYGQGDPSGELAQKACALHKKWLLHFWKSYSKEAHMGLVQSYVDDARFTAYYDAIAPGCAVFLRDAMRTFTGVEA